MADPRIAIVTLGTPGDVIPFVALAIGLRAHGCSVTFFSNEDHASFVENHRFAFIPVCGPERSDSGVDRDSFFEQQLVPSYYVIEREIGRFVASGGPAIAINRLGNLGAIFACERHALPFFSVLLQPDSIWEQGNPITSAMRQSLNVYRRAIGLDAIDTDYVQEPANAFISLFPDWFGYPRSLSAKAGRCFGFPFLDSSDPKPLSPEVTSFISRNGPPIIFTTGTNIRDVTSFRNIAEDLHEQTGIPVLFLSRFGEPATIDKDGFRQLRYVDHAQLLPHAAVVVHNGGIGVTAQAMRAGVPQVAIPLVWDQPDNAARIAALGIGRVIQPADLSSATLSAACRDLMDLDRRQLMVVADAVRRSRAIPDAVDFIRSRIAQ